MMTEQIQWKKVDEIFNESMKCRKCFEQKLAESAFIDVAQPRWIGTDYFKSHPRILIITRNPGPGGKGKQEENTEFKKILYDYRDGKKTLMALFTFQKEYIPKWGKSGKFVKFYMNGIGLDLNEIALANIAWCADSRSKPPSEMLSQCFAINTSKLIQAIKPNIIILSGSETREYYSNIEEITPDTNIIETYSYAYFEKPQNYDLEQTELQRVREEIARFNK